MGQECSMKVGAKVDEMATDRVQSGLKEMTS